MTVEMNSRRMIGSSPEVGSSSTSSSGSGQIAVMSASCVLLAFREMAGLLADIEPELVQQRALGLLIPMSAKRREVVERVAHGHPGVERHGVRHVRKPRFDGHFVARRIQAEDLHLPARRPQQVQQAFDRRRLAGPVTAKEAVAASRLHLQVEAGDGVGPSEAAHELVDRDDGGFGIHGCPHFTAPSRCCWNASYRSAASRRNSALPTWR